MGMEPEHRYRQENHSVWPYLLFKMHFSKILETRALKRGIMSQDSADSGWQGFLSLCSKIESPTECGQLFDLFLTIEEKENLASRFLIVKALLKEELTQREIADTYKVSIAQITRGSNALKIISPELKDLLKERLCKGK